MRLHDRTSRHICHMSIFGYLFVSSCVPSPALPIASIWTRSCCVRHRQFSNALSWPPKSALRLWKHVVLHHRQLCGVMSERVQQAILCRSLGSLTKKSLHCGHSGIADLKAVSGPIAVVRTIG